VFIVVSSQAPQWAVSVFDYAVSGLYCCAQVR